MPDPFGEFERAAWSAGRAQRYHSAVGAITSRPVEALLDAAAVGPGDLVLDVATGPGYVAGRAAARGARVVAVDFSAEMLALAARMHPGIDFREADAADLPLPDATFDAAVANFLMPHVADLPAVVRELARVTRPGGRVALTTWDSPERVRFVGALIEALADANALPPASLPAGPSFFQYAEASELAALLRGAGLADATVATVEFTHRIVDLDAFWEDLLAGTVRVGMLAAAQPPEVQRALRAAYERRVEPHRIAGGYELPCTVKLGSAAKA